MKFMLLFLFAVLININCMAQLDIPKPSRFNSAETQDTSTNYELNGDTLEYFLKNMPVQYTKVDENTYDVLIEHEGDSIYFYLIFKPPFEDVPNSNYISIIAVFELLPEDFKLPYPLLKKLSDINFELHSATISTLENENALFYKSQLWLKQADPELLMFVLNQAHYQIQYYRKILEPYINE